MACGLTTPQGPPQVGRMWTPETLLAVALIFILAGFVKGVAGLGLPTIAIALMAVFVGLKEGIALMVVPTIVTNIWQAFAGGQFVAIVRRFWSLLLMFVWGLTSVYFAWPGPFDALIDWGYAASLVETRWALPCDVQRVAGYGSASSGTIVR